MRIAIKTKFLVPHLLNLLRNWWSFSGSRKFCYLWCSWNNVPSLSDQILRVFPVWKEETPIHCSNKHLEILTVIKISFTIRNELKWIESSALGQKILRFEVQRWENLGTFERCIDWTENHTSLETHQPLISKPGFSESYCQSLEKLKPGISFPSVSSDHLIANTNKRKLSVFLFFSSVMAHQFNCVQLCTTPLHQQKANNLLALPATKFKGH